MKVRHLALALGLSLVMVVGIAGQGKNAQLVILEAQVAGNLLTVTGLNFGTVKPWVFVGGMAVPEDDIDDSHTDTEIMVTLDPFPDAGTYLLSIIRHDRVGKSKSKSKSKSGKSGGRSQRSLGTFDLTLGAVGPQGPQGPTGLLDQPKLDFILARLDPGVP